MAMLITYPDGSTRLIPEATRVDEQNFHEGMYDFYDDRGALLEQIDMHSRVKWRLVAETEESAKEAAPFLKSSGGREGNAGDEKDETMR
ncbi:MAG TPA: hypothetical protein VGX92_12475 [Pyrinomonadaceae bacterium]|jgi:hypothetical protein|nr:hypothetical protein [Pyrinomonadaceae bacterium]